jgi:hypothetical protein
MFWEYRGKFFYGCFPSRKRFFENTGKPTVHDNHGKNKAPAAYLSGA